MNILKKLNQLFKDNFILLKILLLSTTVRIFQLGEIPPSVSSVHLLRNISAICGIISNFLIYFLGYKLFNKNKKIALLISITYAVLPIAILENRVSSWISISTTLIIVSFLFITSNIIYKKILGILFIFVSLVYFKDNIGFLNITTTEFKYKVIITNIFSTISFDKLFFNNDSFWKGGYRNYGMMYPEFIPIFILGLFNLIKIQLLPIYIYAITIIFLTSLNPNYPEAREIGLLSPIISITLGMGIYKFYQIMRKINRNLFVRVFCVIYFLIIIYGIINFFHHYFVHYNLRVKQERFHENGEF